MIAHQIVATHALCLLLLASCSNTSVPSVDAGRDSQADDVRRADLGRDDLGTPDASDRSDASDADLPVDAVLQDILARLRSDLSGTLRAVGNADGWPAQVNSGRLVVSTDPALTRVAGEHDGWVGVAMAADVGFHWVVLRLPAGSRYKLTDGTNFVADPWSRAYEWDEFGMMSRVPPVEAHLERFLEVGNDAIPARTIRVWVPAATPTHTLYAHDGQNLFDPGAPFGSWTLQNAVGPATMVIGIDNSPARMDEYAPVPDVVGGAMMGGRADEYAEYVEDVVRPLVGARYREAPVVGVLGSSMGGLVSMHMALRNPDAWDFAGSLDGTLSFGSLVLDNVTVVHRFASQPGLDVKLYIDSGSRGTCVDSDGDGLEDDVTDGSPNYCMARQLREILLGQGYAEGADFWHYWEPDAPHNEAAWAARAALPLSVFEAITP